METESAIKLVKELKQNKLIPKFNEFLLSDVASQVTNSYKYLNEEWVKDDINDEANQALPIVMNLTS